MFALKNRQVLLCTRVENSLNEIRRKLFLVDSVMGGFLFLESIPNHTWGAMESGTIILVRSLPHLFLWMYENIEMTSFCLCSDSVPYERAIKEQENRARSIIQGMSAGLCKSLIRCVCVCVCVCVHVCVGGGRILFMFLSCGGAGYWLGSCTGLQATSSTESIYKTDIFTC